MKFDLPKNVIKLFNIFEGYEIYLVGGCVRDLIMKTVPHDYDFTTNATPNQMKQIAEENNIQILPTGEQYGTMTFKFESELYEVTTFRGEKNSIYSDGRRPDNVEFGVSLFEDLSRRDFTINAIAYNPKKGFIDPFNGKADIKIGLIKAVGEADKRFKEDALRMLRALRFSSRFNFKIDPDISEAIYKNYKLIDNVSKERIGSELLQIFETHYTNDLLVLLCNYIFRSLNVGFNIMRGYLYPHYSVLSKLWYFTSQLSEKELNKFAFGNTFVKEIIHLNIAQKYFYENNYKLNFEYKYLLDICKHKDERIALLEILNLSKEIKDLLIKTLLNKEPISIAELEINGNDIKDILNFKGEKIGIILKQCQNYIWKYPNKNRKEDLMKYIKSLR